MEHEVTLYMQGLFITSRAWVFAGDAAVVRWLAETPVPRSATGTVPEGRRSKSDDKALALYGRQLRAVSNIRASLCKRRSTAARLGAALSHRLRCLVPGPGPARGSSAPPRGAAGSGAR